MGLLENKIAVITGSTRGLGLAMAQAFAREGASVVVASRSAEAVTKTVDVAARRGASGQRSRLRRERSGPGASIGGSRAEDLWPF